MIKNEIYFDKKLRRRKKRMLKIKIYSSLAAFFVLFIGTIYLIVYSSLFHIAQINTDKIQSDADTKIKIINGLKKFFLEQSKITKFLGPENILIWQEKKIDKFLKEKPEISEIKIKKDYFKRQIEIEAKTREKFGVWCLQKQNYSEKILNNPETETDSSESSFCGWFDKNGILFAEAFNIEGQLINKISDFSGRELKLGDKVLDEKLFNNLIKIFEVLERANLKIKSLKLDNLEFQEITTESSPKIFFSLKFSPNFSLEFLKSLKNKGLTGIEYIDLRVENRVYYK